MEYITKNGFRFTEKNNSLSMEQFISIIEDTTLILLMNDLVINFNNDIYIDTSELPF